MKFFVDVFAQLWKKYVMKTVTPTQFPRVFSSNFLYWCCHRLGFKFIIGKFLDDFHYSWFSSSRAPSQWELIIVPPCVKCLNFLRKNVLSRGKPFRGRHWYGNHPTEGKKQFLNGASSGRKTSAWRESWLLCDERPLSPTESSGRFGPLASGGAPPSRGHKRRPFYSTNAEECV